MRFAFIHEHIDTPGKNTRYALLRTASIPKDGCTFHYVFDSEPDDAAELKTFMKDPARTQRELSRLDAELKLAKPDIIVAFGATALWVLTGQTTLDALRGHAALSTVVCAGQKFVATYAPDMVEKQWKLFQVVVNDLLKAEREAARGPGVYTPVRRIRVDPRLNDLLKLTKPILSAPILSLDIETSWGQITHFGIAWSEEDAVSIPFVDHRSPSNSYFRSAWEEWAVWEWLRMILASPVPKLGQNYGSYDFLYIIEKMGIPTRNYREDTCLIHHALYPELPKSLEFLAAAYSEQGAWKHLGRRYSADETEKGDG